MTLPKDLENSNKYRIRICVNCGVFNEGADQRDVCGNCGGKLRLTKVIPASAIEEKLKEIRERILEIMNDNSYSFSEKRKKIKEALK